MDDSGTHHESAVVLVIDDDMVSREVIATLLTMSGYAVYTAEDGEAGLRLLKSDGCVPEVILMDTQMPGLNGVDLIAALRRESRARLYAVSASAISGEILSAVDAFLLKPLDVEALAGLIEGRGGPKPDTSADLDTPVISMDVLTKLRQMMPEQAVRQIYVAIVADLAVRIGALDIAMDKGDLEEVRRIGHAIKGGCAMAGAMQAAGVGAQLEMITPEMITIDRPDEGIAPLRDLRAAMQRLENMLKSGLPE